MKIRSGFVSNSSSSSFLLVFKKKPKSREDVQGYIWPNESRIEYPYNDNDEHESFAVSEAAESVWNAIKDQKPLKAKDIIGEFKCSHEIGYDRDVCRTWQEAELQRGIQAKKLSEEFRKKNKGKIVYRVEYSDNEGKFGCTMEHGEVFHNIEHVSFSLH